MFFNILLLSIKQLEKKEQTTTRWATEALPKCKPSHSVLIEPIHLLYLNKDYAVIDEIEYD